MKLKINSDTINTEREVEKKEESIYGNYYTLKCGWFVEYDNHFKRWEITTLKKGGFIGRFLEKEITEIT
jgi:hypothetical protein